MMDVRDFDRACEEITRAFRTGLACGGACGLVVGAGLVTLAWYVASLLR